MEQDIRCLWRGLDRTGFCCCGRHSGMKDVGRVWSLGRSIGCLRGCCGRD